MFPGKGRLAAAALLASAVNAAPAGACATNATPFNFDVEVTMRMRTFPWLTLHLKGVGRYEPGKYYRVRFSNLPWFVPRQQHVADLSVLDPAMWPVLYSYQNIGTENGMSVFALRYLQAPATMKAVVALDSTGCARNVDVTYNDGTRLHLNVECASVQGVTIPTSMTAAIKVPHASFTANAAFGDYTFSPAGATAALLHVP